MLTAAALNARCDCLGPDLGRLASLLPAAGPAALGALPPTLFAPVPLFAETADLAALTGAVAALDRVARRLAGDPAGPRGVLMGYDFHLTADGPKLIEVNTNAGGALLAARAIDASGWRVAASFERDLVDAFRAEWATVHPERELRRVAIVDERPEQQFLYPEFLLYRDLFLAAGIDAVVADPAELRWDGATLTVGGAPIDLVYARWTDFALASDAAAPLRAAHEAGAVVLTPSPAHHATHANKANLCLWSDPDALRARGVPEEDAARLARVVPRTVLVEPGDAERLWGERRRWFFKPVAGFGSRATYRGDKLTRGRWGDVLAERTADGGPGYVAQELVPPSERSWVRDGAEVTLKSDVRVIAYAGRVQLVFARLYQGQTTNLRTEGGGFAAVLPVPPGCC